MDKGQDDVIVMRPLINWRWHLHMSRIDILVLAAAVLLLGLGITVNGLSPAWWLFVAIGPLAATAHTRLQRVRLTPDALELRNPLRTRRIPWSDITGLAVEGRKWLVADLVDGSSVTLPVPLAVSSRLRDDAFPERSDAIARYWAAATDRPPEAATVSHRPLPHCR